MLEKKKLLVSGREVFWFLMPITLGYFVMFVFPWDLIWIALERIFDISVGTSIYNWGSYLFKVASIACIAVDLKWNSKREIFYEKGKIDLKIKILLLFFLFLIGEITPEMIWKLHGYAGEMERIYASSPFVLNGLSALNILLLADTFVCAWNEELLCRYITCNCLRTLYINNGVIIFFQALIFAMVHGYGIIDSLNVFIGGFIYGIILYLTRTPPCGWLLHSAYNLKIMSDGPLENWLFGIAFLISAIYIVISDMLSNPIYYKQKRSNCK